MDVEDEELGCHVDTGIGLMNYDRSTREQVEDLPEEEACESAGLPVHN